ncbi:slipin family protein [Rubinisphaera margarita]|uniref:slipin family protein n=1 Tax=Rubinisphaera margarita TaxID=2909586 RepID=UPI001EE8BE54|nr:slipin family protein [Rubinisphaera margarita]MCG6156533.1 slipin family protein [Rubinisphaera margarita]
MIFLKRYKIRSYEVGLYFRDGEFRGLIEQGTRWLIDPLGKVRVDVVSKRDPWLVHDKLDLIVNSGVLKDRAVVLDLQDHERALVWIENRFSHILPAGLYSYWNGQKKVRVEVVDARQVRFEHPELKVIAKSPLAQRTLDVCSVNRDHVGVLFIDGRYVETLAPGLYAFWKGQSDAKVVEVDLRETMVDVSGQDIMTADKVTLRLNAVVTYKVADARKAVSQTDDVRQALYRETQLVLRSVIGARELDAFLTEKDAVGSEVEDNVRRRAGELGLEIASVGIRDVILPGDMKDLMNKVTEARKAAEANLISRREETAAMRSQANTAKLLADNPVLMRLRELEILEKLAGNGKLNIVVGEKGLSDRVVNLL